MANHFVRHDAYLTLEACVALRTNCAFPPEVCVPLPKRAFCLYTVVIHHRSFYTNFVLMEPYFIYMRADLQCYMCVKEVYCHFPYDYTWNNALSSWLSYLCNHQFSSDNGLAIRRNISNVGTLRDRRAAVWAPRRSIAFRNSAGTWSRAPGKQFGVLDRWRDRHTRPARWSDMLRIRPVRWWKWNRIRIDLARLADPIH